MATRVTPNRKTTTVTSGVKNTIKSNNFGGEAEVFGGSVAGINNADLVNESIDMKKVPSYSSIGASLGDGQYEKSSVTNAKIDAQKNATYTPKTTVKDTIKSNIGLKQPSTLYEPDSVKGQIQQRNFPGLVEPVLDEEGYLGESAQTQEERLREKIRQEEQGLQQEQNKAALIEGGKTMEQIKQEEEYLQRQREIQLKQSDIQEKQAQLQGNANIQNAQRQLGNLKRNLAYLGTMGRPGVSSAALDGVDRQLQDAQNVYDRIVKREKYAEDMRELGREFDKEVFDKRMQDLNDTLNAQVSDSIQQVFDKMTADEIAGKLDSMDEVNALTEQYLDTIDRSVEGITLRNIQQRQMLIDEYTDLLDQVETFVENKNTINKDMSIAKGFYVDGNGTPLRDMETGGYITLPDELIDTIIDDKSGKMYVISRDADGNVITEEKQLMTPTSVGSKTASNLAEKVLQGKLALDDALGILTPGTEDAFWSRYNAGSIDISKPGVLQDLTGLRGTDIANTGNVGNDLNNPGNLTRGGVGDQYAMGYVTVTGQDGVTRDFLVFPNIETGNRAVQADLEAKMTGGSNVISPNATLGELLDVWVGGAGAGAGYKQVVSDVSGYGMNEIIGGLDSALVLQGIQQAEGATGEGHDYSYLTQQMQQQADVGGIKDTYLDMLRKGQVTNSDMLDIAQIAEQEGWSDEFREANMQGLKVNLTDTQLKRFDASKDDFEGNQVVKAFEEGLNQFQGLAYALSDESGPGDMAGIFSFMKTMDPTSVVRESEYEAAARSAGVYEYAKTTYKRLMEGRKLSDKQSEAFKRIAKEFIKQKANSYDRLYNNMKNEFEKFGIPLDLLPASASKQLYQFLDNDMNQSVQQEDIVTSQELQALRDNLDING